MKYKFVDGKEIEIPVISVRDADDVYDVMFKLNLPDTQDGFDRGNGEGVWAYSDDETKKIHDEEIVLGGIYFARILNDSVYYPGKLKYNEIVAFEMRGKYRPIAFFTELNEKYGPPKADEIRAAMHNMGGLRCEICKDNIGKKEDTLIEIND